ncbi:ankyrin repeat-containing domain protein [Chytridium lagenaria]|nr:ankyrin repeat-containing domain protein [Chytridium lagenaria]
MASITSNTTSTTATNTLPLEVWCDILAYAVEGSCSELARLSTINRDIRNASFHSVSMRCDALIRAFGKSHVLAAILDGSVHPPAPAYSSTSAFSSPGMAAGVLAAATGGVADISLVGQGAEPTPMSVFLAQLNSEDSDEDEDSEDEGSDSDEEDEDEEDEDEEDEDEDVEEGEHQVVVGTVSGNDSGGTLNGNAEESASADSSTLSNTPAGISIVISSNSTSSPLSSSSSASSQAVISNNNDSTCMQHSPCSSDPVTFLSVPSTSSSSSFLTGQHVASTTIQEDDDTPAAVSPPSPALIPSHTLKPDPRVWIFGINPSMTTTTTVTESTSITTTPHVPGVAGARLLSALVSRGADITVNDGTPLRVVVERGRADLVESLLLEGRKSEAANYRDGSGLRHACRNGDVETVKALLKCGADVHVRRDEALRFASHSGNSSIVSLLLSHGADPTSMHHAALFNAADMGHVQVLRLLLSPATHRPTANPNATLHGVPSNRNLLKNPAAFGNLEVVKVLLECGTDVGHGGGVALTEARRMGREKVVEVLEAAIRG